MASRKMDLKVVSLNRVYSPVPFDKLVQLAAQGRLSSQDQVRPVGTEAWYPVTDVPALAAALPEPPPAAAAGAVEIESGERWTMPSSAAKAEEAEMDMAPMIDVTFLLLIFFMLSNSMANPTPMDVPTAVYGRGVTLEGQQQLLVDEEGGYYLGDIPSDASRAESLDALVAEVGENAKNVPEAMDVIINGHKKANYLHVRKLIEKLAGMEGLGNVMLGVEEQLR
jgi:biopolymer transport protein ExbD